MRRRWTKSTLIAAAVIFLFLGACEADAECPQDINCPPTITKISDFSREIPYDWICGDKDVEKWNAHPEFARQFADVYSWKALIALLTLVKKNDSLCEEPKNKFPIEDVLSDPRGSSDTDGEFPCVMTWGGRPEIFGPRDVQRFDTNADMTGAPLFDKNGMQVYYEILVNDVVAKKIKNSNPPLNTLTGQIKAAARGYELQFTAGQCEPRGRKTRGAIEVKLAWKELLEGKDDPKRFLKRALKFSDGHSVKAGVVGIHIVHLTRDHQPWIWSTFEHVDNDTMFNDPNCPETICPVNARPQCGENAPPHSLCPANRSLQPVRSVRLIRKDPTVQGEPIAEETKKLNDVVRPLLEGQNSIFRYYQLVGTQFRPIFPEDRPLPEHEREVLSKRMKVDQLRNLVIEPYIPQSSSSCIGCHSKAMIPHSECVPDGTKQVKADLSLFLRNGPWHMGCVSSRRNPR